MVAFAKNALQGFASSARSSGNGPLEGIGMKAEPRHAAGHSLTQASVRPAPAGGNPAGKAGIVALHGKCPLDRPPTRTSIAAANGSGVTARRGAHAIARDERHETSRITISRISVMSSIA
jgi:hypothetical protein